MSRDDSGRDGRLFSFCAVYQGSDGLSSLFDKKFPVRGMPRALLPFSGSSGVSFRPPGKDSGRGIKQERESSGIAERLRLREAKSH
jgi:hypothetical protein